MQKLCRECGIRKPHENFHKKGYTSAGNIIGDNIDTLTNAVLYLKERGSYG